MRSIWIGLGLLVVAAAIAFTVLSLAREERTSPCRTRGFEGSEFTVCAFDPSSQRLTLTWQSRDGAPLRTFDMLERDLGADADTVEFAMNAGMFSVTGGPIGLYVEDGDGRTPLNLRDGPGNFHLKPNGVFSVDADGAARVETADAYAARDPSPQWATQSGPMLLINGELHPEFQENGPSRYIRNGVGVTDGGTALFVISESAVSFGRFARFFRDELGCDDALFLDGIVSSLWLPRKDRMDGGFPLGPMVVVARQ